MTPDGASRLGEAVAEVLARPNTTQRMRAAAAVWMLEVQLGQNGCYWADCLTCGARAQFDDPYYDDNYASETGVWVCSDCILDVYGAYTHADYTPTIWKALRDHAAKVRP